MARIRKVSQDHRGKRRERRARVQEMARNLGILPVILRTRMPKWLTMTVEIAVVYQGFGLSASRTEEIMKIEFIPINARRYTLQSCRSRFRHRPVLANSANYKAVSRIGDVSEIFLLIHLVPHSSCLSFLGLPYLAVAMDHGSDEEEDE